MTILTYLAKTTRYWAAKLKISSVHPFHRSKSAALLMRNKKKMSIFRITDPYFKKTIEIRYRIQKSGLKVLAMKFRAALEMKGTRCLQKLVIRLHLASCHFFLKGSAFENCKSRDQVPLRMFLNHQLRLSDLKNKQQLSMTKLKQV